jgi:hypothetical protein
MAVKGADADTRRSRDSFEAGLRAASAESSSCDLEQTVAIPERVGPRLSRSALVQRLLVQRPLSTVFSSGLFSHWLIEKRMDSSVSLGRQRCALAKTRAADLLEISDQSRARGMPPHLLSRCDS